MTVNSYSYAQASDVQALIGDIVTGRVFTTGTAPKLAEVEALLDDVAAEVHATLAGEGYPIYTQAVMAATYPLALPVLKAANLYGACALILQAVPGMGVSPDDLNGPISRSNQFTKRYQARLDTIKGQTLDLLGLQRTIRRTQRIASAQRLDDEGNTKAPFFKRGLADIPGSRTLIEQDTIQ